MEYKVYKSYTLKQKPSGGGTSPLNRFCYSNLTTYLPVPKTLAISALWIIPTMFLYN